MAFAAPERLDALILMDTGHGAVVSIDPTLVDAAISVVRSGGIEALAEFGVQSGIVTRRLAG